MALETWDGRSLQHGVAHLLAAREKRGPQLAGPWSVAELELTDADFDKLLSWGRHADGPSIKRLIERTDVLPLPEPCAHAMLPGDATAGLLLLALCAECTARLGSSEAPWRASVEALGDSSLRRTLFSEGGAALKPLKDALHAAASRCSMRSGDLEDPTQNRWYQLLLLQGGHPRGDSALLPGRLSNPEGRTFLVGALQQEVPSFRKAWEALERFRARNCTRDKAEKALAACPFFRRPYKEILDAALRIVEVGNGPREPVPAASVLSASLRLEWDGGAATPCAVLCPAFADDEDLGSRVTLLVDGLWKATYRRTGGTLTRFGDGVLTVPLASRWTLTAKGNDDATVLAEVALFEGDEGSGARIACFDESGARCGANTQAVRYVIADEPIETKPPQRVWLDAEGLAVAAVEPGTIVTTSDGLHLWPASVAGHAADIQALRLEIAEWHNGDQVGALTVRLVHAPSIRVKSARVGSASFRVVAGESAAARAETVVEGVVPPTRVTPEVRLTVTASFDGRLFQKTLYLRAFTAASLDGAWLEPSSIVEAARLHAGALHVSLGKEFEGRDARLTAGGATARIDVDARRAPRMAQAPGYGEPLALCGQEPWLAGPRQVLAARVENHGDVVSHEHRDGQLRISHRLDLVDATDYWVLVWPRSAGPIALSLGEGARLSANEALAVAYHAEGAPRAVALCYGGAIMGASWAADWSSELASAGVDATTLVKLIRLLSLPVLATANLGLVATRLRELGVAEATDAIAGYLDDKEPLTVGDAGRALLPSGDRDRWPLAARAVLIELRLSNEAELKAISQKMHVRFPRLRQDFSRNHGVATPQQLVELAEYNQTHQGWFGAYVDLLLKAGAIHPRDAIYITPYPKGERDRLARKLAHASRGLDSAAFDARPDGKRPSPTRLRRDYLNERRRQLHSTDASITPTLAAVEAWVTQTSAPKPELREALLDELMSQRIQLEMLDQLAFSKT